MAVDASPVHGAPITGELRAGAGVRVQDLWFGYRSQAPVLRSVSLEVCPGRLMMIVGASGSGKSTLLKLMKGLLAPQRGEITVAGHPVAAGDRRTRLDPAVAYIPQQLGLIRGRTVMDNTLMGALGRLPSWRGTLGIYHRDTLALAQQTLDSLGLSHKAGERVRSLSGGERQRVAIARALMQKPEVLIADEFVSQLDPATTAAIMTLVRGVAEMGVTVITTTHELDLVANFADEVVVLGNGEKLLQAPAREVTAAQLAGMMAQ